MGAAEGEVLKKKLRHGECIAVEVRDEASVAVSIVEGRTRGRRAIGGFNVVQRTTCDCAEVVGGDGGVCCGTCRGLARDAVGARDVKRLRGVEFAFAENAFEGSAWEPHEVAACVHVKGYGLRRV